MKKKTKIIIWAVAISILSICCAIGIFLAVRNSSTNNESTDGTSDNSTIVEYVGEKYAPTITVDYGDFGENNIPNAVINKPYKLFTASAKDLFGKEIYINMRVWIFYDSTTRALVNAENGIVTPTAYGVYTVEFTALDKWGNETTVFYDFKCLEKEPLKVNVGSDDNSYNAGYAINVNDGIIENAIGKIKLNVKAVLDGRSEISYDVVNGKFIPLYAGTYSIVYSVSDYNETSQSSYKITVNAHQMPVWQSDLNCKKYYFVDCEYVLEDLQAYSFVDGTPKAVDVKISVTDSQNQTIELNEERVFKPLLEGQYKITYTAQANGNQDVQEKTVNVVNVNYATNIAVENYFVGNVQKRAQDNEIVLIANSDATVEFINVLNPRNLRVDLSVVKEFADNFESFDIVLTDAKDNNKSICFNFAKSGETNGILTASGGRYVKTEANFYKDETLTFVYDNSIKTVKLGAEESVPVLKMESGELFDGFDCEEVILSIRFNGVTGNTELCVRRLGNQAIYKDCGDTVAPEIIYSRYLGGIATIDDVVTIDRVYVYDVLSPICKVSYIIKTPNGDYVTDINGTKLSPDITDYRKSYQFKIESFGKYVVTINAEDGQGRKSSATYNIESVNTQSIQIEIQNDQSIDAKLGDTVTVRSIIVPGYNLVDLSIRVFVMTPDGITKQVENNQFVVDLKGEYEVWYYVSDADDNLDMAHYTLTVS